MSVSNSSQAVWPSLAPYVVPPVAASVAIVPAFYDMVAKSAMQKGLQPPSMSFNSIVQGVKGGLGAAPTVGFMVGTQMVLQNRIEKAFLTAFLNLSEDSNRVKTMVTLVSSAIVGAVSAPLLAVYNGKTMMPPWSVKESLSKFSLKQAGAITLQETGFVAGLAAADTVASPMKQMFGDSKATEYVAAATAGALGSLVGHPGNTALTRWQNGMTVDHFRQLGWGALRKARGNALFAVVYKLGKEVLNSTVKSEK